MRGISYDAKNTGAIELAANDRRLELLAETGLMDQPSMSSLDRLARIARAALRVPVALVSLVDERRQFFTSQCGLGEPWASRRETPLTHSFCQHVVLSKEPLIVSDARADARMCTNPAIDELGVIAYAGMPIRMDDEPAILGSFCVIDGEPRQWTYGDLALLEDLAEAVGAEIALRRRAHLAEGSETELRELIDHLEQRYGERSRAAREIEHDIRTPLSVISMGITSLRRHEGAVLFPEVEQLLRLLERNTDHAVTLSRRLGPNATSGLAPHRFDLGKLVRSIGEDAQSRLEALTLSVDCASALLVVADETDVRRCVDNLVSNSARFAARQLRLRAYEHAGFAWVEVDDDGAGLRDEDYLRVWDRSVRFHRREGKSGSGLGLTIVRALVRKHEGKVRAAPSPLGGASFGFGLPLA